jgi:hypothetical protein|tara:strand:- start:10020 stop:10244 length:225 start_codon:yes stop_codon:yes gene_type:complete
MAKVSVHLGFTFRVGPLETNQYSRIDVDVRDIDTELSVKDQMNEASNTLDQVWTVVREAVDEKIETVLDAGSTS